MITDCGNIEVLAYAWEKSLVSTGVQRMIQEALVKRFGTERIPEGTKLQFLTDNGSEYIDKGLVKWMEAAAGFEVCNTPVRSPESNGVSEAVNRWIRADYINQNLCVSFEDVRTKMPGWIEGYNTVCPHERLGGVSAKDYYEKWLKSV
jgi:transposase InsO family protein